jgi:hypothetical protein
MLSWGYYKKNANERLDLIPLRETGRPGGVEKAVIKFKLLYGWRLMSGY